MSEQDAIRCGTWRERLARASAHRWWRASGFTAADRRLAHDPIYCLLGEAAVRIGKSFDGLMTVAQASGLYYDLIYIEARFVWGVETNRYLQVDRAIAEIEALLPSLGGI